jgi:hypothetical protein
MAPLGNPDGVEVDLAAIRVEGWEERVEAPMGKPSNILRLMNNS